MSESVAILLSDETETLWKENVSESSDGRFFGCVGFASTVKVSKRGYPKYLDITALLKQVYM